MFIYFFTVNILPKVYKTNLIVAFRNVDKKMLFRSVKRVYIKHYEMQMTDNSYLGQIRHTHWGSNINILNTIHRGT